jgi:RNA polymerase sigma-70 factor (ECF subfamily)
MNTEITKIWTEFQVEIKRFILNKTRNQADTDDILQEVFVKIIRHFEKVNQAKNLRQYLYGIVRNAITDHYRKKVYTTTEENLTGELTEEESHNLNETLADCCIKPFIQKLPEKYRNALLLSELEGFSQKKLAGQLNISYSGAKSRVQRGREKLKELILACCAVESDRYGNLIEVEKKNCICD